MGRNCTPNDPCDLCAKRRASYAPDGDADHRALLQIASSLAEFERVEAVGMASATMPDKIDALLLELARLRRLDRGGTDAIAERDEARRERDDARILLAEWRAQAARVDAKRDDAMREHRELVNDFIDMRNERDEACMSRDEARETARTLAEWAGPIDDGVDADIWDAVARAIAYPRRGG